VALGIGLIGVIIAAWVLVVSFGTGGSKAVGTASPPQQSADDKALAATIASLQQQLQQDPTNVTAMIDLGNSYYDAGRYSDAIPWYEKALQWSPTNTDVRTDLGTAYFYSGNLDKAKEEWFKVLEQDPNKVQTHYNLAVLYSHETPPDTENAVKEWQTVIKLAPNSDQAKNAQKRLQELGK
jgi:cytochrome c-type biogenesis protein CcmH/NrfG